MSNKPRDPADPWGTLVKKSNETPPVKKPSTAPSGGRANPSGRSTGSNAPRGTTGGSGGRPVTTSKSPTTTVKPVTPSLPKNNTSPVVPSSVTTSPVITSPVTTSPVITSPDTTAPVITPIEKTTDSSSTVLAPLAKPVVGSVWGRPGSKPPESILAGTPKVQPKPTDPLPTGSSTSAVTACTLGPRERGYPMGFASLGQFQQCMQELCDAARDSGITCSVAGVRGSAATNSSNSPHKLGKPFDHSGPGKSDIDAFLISDTRLRGCRPSKAGFYHPSKVNANNPLLRQWARKWKDTLGRDISPGIHQSDAAAMQPPTAPLSGPTPKPDFIKYVCK